MLKRRLGVVLCSAMVLVTGATDSFGITRRTPSPRIGLPITNARPPGSIVWKACLRPLVDVKLECGRLDVALDRSTPTSRRVSISLARLKARADGPRLGVLIVNPGGPGGSGVDTVRDFATDRIYGRAATSFGG